MFKGNSQIIESWMLFYSMNFYAMLAFYAFYTKEFSKYDAISGAYKERTTTVTEITDMSMVNNSNRESLLAESTIGGPTLGANFDDQLTQKKKEKLFDAQDIITKRFKVFDLEADTYSMAFRALHKKSRDLMELTDEEQRAALKSAFLVFAMQTILLYIIYWTLFSSQITSPGHVMTMGASFICCLLMHLQTQSDIQQG
jgi:hypothetical protein